MIFFDVPADVLCQEVFSYLSLSDLLSLNIACTNKYYRPQLNRIWSIYKEPRYISIHKKVLHLKCIGLDVVEIWCMTIDGSGRVDIDESTLWPYVYKISGRCPKLKVLNVGYDISFTDEMAMQLVRGCPQLEELRLLGDVFSDELITELAQLCHRLHTLYLTSNQITDVSIESICDNCPDLRSIRACCCNLTDASLIAIASTYPHLHSIDISGSKCTDDGLISVADKCPGLRSVSVGGDNITSRSLTALWTANPNLTQVGMPENSSDEDIVLLVKSCGQLKRLSMWRCNHVSDAAVIAVAEHCPQLNSLDISECTKISDVSLIALGRHCHELKVIDISSIPHITDVGVAALAADCPLLEAFKASDTHITDTSLTALLGCPKLQRLAMKNTGVTTEGVSMFKKQRPNCVLLKI